MNGVIPLSAPDLAIAALLVVVAGVVSLLLELGLERKLLLASVRTVLQLLLLGQILGWVFDIEHPFLVIGVMSVMVVAAGRAATQRSSRTFPTADLRASATLVITGFATTFAVTGLIIRVEPWYLPQYLIPLLGMVLGNSLTGISLSLDHLLEALDAKSDRVEMDLALGATRWEAAREPLSAAVKRGMIPIINSMMVVGIVSLPGMMTGQILSGSDPIDAVKYQIVVMFMLAASTALGSMTMAWLVYKKLFNAEHQLRRELIRKRE